MDKLQISMINGVNVNLNLTNNQLMQYKGFSQFPTISNNGGTLSKMENQLLALAN